MANLLYVDNSNVWIEGMHVAAHASGMAPDVWTAVKGNICDHNWTLDFGKLFAFAGGDKAEVRKAALFGSRPPKNDSLWAAAERNGFNVITYDRNVANAEKKIDTDIVATMIEDSFTILQPGDEVTLVSGDADYVPAIEKLKKRGIAVHVVFWKHASKEIKAIATTFTELDPYLQHLKR
ncbi:NYN domain-containing protein [Aeromonas caviae]|uniref:NYN domain-containing protein n=1 Tax=Aeromonas caviae TaxID=648 RepID=UPI001D0A4F09|nr:NYN domain-containing protein [Aeromonas caviae]MCR3986018.1 NYN domain-containing protein [Aeromonas caviae]MDH0240555.1 NYN domain-containing protein [Aeromonas caviae]MDT8953975.1 NYN domain-containing protein [Aeromonas caviae]UDN28837.1 NYN domain-containing protein [Aeromonas caviae]